MKKKQIKRDRHTTRIKKAKMLKHLKLYLGKVGKAFEASGVKSSTFYDWLKKDEEYKQAVCNVYLGAENFAIDRIMEIIGDDVNEAIKIQKSNAKKIKIMSK